MVHISIHIHNHNLNHNSIHNRTSKRSIQKIRHDYRLNHIICIPDDFKHRNKLFDSLSFLWYCKFEFATTVQRDLSTAFRLKEIRVHNHRQIEFDWQVSCIFITWLTNVTQQLICRFVRKLLQTLKLINVCTGWAQQAIIFMCQTGYICCPFLLCVHFFFLIFQINDLIWFDL